jgi:hypothetical protein
MKKCPYCKTEIPADASKCMRCGEWVDGPGDARPTSHRASEVNV